MIPTLNYNYVDIHIINKNRSNFIILLYVKIYILVGLGSKEAIISSCDILTKIHSCYFCSELQRIILQRLILEFGGQKNVATLQGAFNEC